jgi:hypothetical protein
MNILEKNLKALETQLDRLTQTPKKKGFVMKMHVANITRIPNITIKEKLKFLCWLKKWTHLLDDNVDLDTKLSLTHQKLDEGLSAILNKASERIISVTEVSEDSKFSLIMGITQTIILKSLPKHLLSHRLDNITFNPTTDDIAIHQDEFALAAEDLRMVDETKNEAHYAHKFIQSHVDQAEKEKR